MELKKSKPVIIVTGGDGGYGNLGDEWLADSVRLRYAKIKYKYRIIFLMQIPRKKSDGFEYATDYKEDFKKLNIKNNDIKAVHFYGGGYLNNYWSHLKLWLYDYLVETGLPTKRIFFTGVGLGPLNLTNLIKIKDISEKTKFFGTRDYSYRMLLNKQKFMFDESIYSLKKPIINKIKSKKILINFRMADHVGISNKGIKKMLNSVNEILEESNNFVEYFPMIEQPGFSEKKEIISTLSSLGMPDQKVLDRPKNYIELLGLVSSAAVIITTSYHATLASLYSGKPVVAVYGNSYYHKKFSTLKKVLPTNLLKVVHISKINRAEVKSHMFSSDSNIDLKLNKLRKYSDDAYNNYENYLKNEYEE